MWVWEQRLKVTKSSVLSDILLVMGRLYPILVQHVLLVQKCTGENNVAFPRYLYPTQEEFLNLVVVFGKGDKNPSFLSHGKKVVKWLRS